MTPDVFIAIAAMACLLAVAVGAALVRGGQLERLREVLGADRDADVEREVRRALSARADAEWRARQAAEDLASLATMVGAVVHLDDDLRVTLASPTAHTLLQRGAGTLEGRSAIEAFGDHRIEQVVATARQIGAAQGEVGDASDGRGVLHVRARRSPVSGVWVVMEDVSELRRLQRIRAEFIDNLSHELRTPVTTVRLLTETVIRELETIDVPPGLRDRITKIDIESAHLAQMVSEILDLSRIEQGSAPPELEDMDVAAVVTAAVERLRLFADRQGVEFALELPAQLPHVRADEERIGQLLINLLHNAVKFSPAHGAVTIRAHAAPGEVVVTVTDRGPGIPRRDVDRVFERFYKVDKSRVRGRGGTGLGLAIARHIAETHGGRIWLDSVEGSGATFSVALPLGGPAG